MKTSSSDSPQAGGPTRRLVAAWLVALPIVWAPPLSTFSLPKAALAWVGAALLLCARRGGEPLRWPLAARLFAAAFALGVPALLLQTDDLTAGLDRLALDGAVLAVLGALLGGGLAGGRYAGPDRLAPLVDAAILGGTLAAALDLIAGLAGSAVLALADRPPFGNGMIAAAHAAVVAPLAVARAAASASAGDGRGAALRYGAAALLLVSLGASGSLGGVVAGSVGVATAWCLTGARQRRRALLVGALAAGLGLAVALTPGPRRLVAHDVEARLYTARVGAAALREAPLTGHGPGDWRAAFYGAQAARLRARPADAIHWSSERRPHNAILGRAVEDGLPAALLLAAALVLAVGVALRRRRPEAGALAAFALTTFYAFPLRSPPTALLLPLLLAGLAVRARPAPTTPGGRHAARAGRWVAMALAVALAGWAGVRVASDALRVAGAPEAALRVNPSDPDALFDAGLVALGGGRPVVAQARIDASLARRPSLAAALMAGNAALAAGDLDVADGWYAQALAWHPNYSLALHNRAWGAALRGDLGEARRLADEAVRRNPNNPALRPLRDLLRD